MSTESMRRAFFAVLVLTVRCFYPHGLFLAAQSSHSFHSFHSSLNRRPKRLSYRSGHTALVHNRSGMLAQAAQELLYLTGIAVRRDILTTGIDCALFLPARLISGGVSRLPQNTTQPYPAGALHIFTSSLPNVVWQLHT